MHLHICPFQWCNLSQIQQKNINPSLPQPYHNIKSKSVILSCHLKLPRDILSKWYSEKFRKFKCKFYRTAPVCYRNTTLLKRHSLYEFTSLLFLAVQSVANIIEKYKSPSTTASSVLGLIFCNAGSSHPDMFCQNAIRENSIKFNCKSYRKAFLCCLHKTLLGRGSTTGVLIVNFPKFF